MAKLTDTQLVVLSKAAQRKDGAAIVPKGLTKAPAAKVAASLINRKLMREIRAKEGMPVWRRDEQGRDYALVILRAGQDAIGVGEGNVEVEPSDAASALANHSIGSRKAKSQKADALSSARSEAAGSPRAGSKQARVIDMLRRKDGAAIEELTAATQWLPHTARAVLTGLRKRGYVLDRQRQEGETRYKIVASPQVAQAA